MYGTALASGGGFIYAAGGDTLGAGVVSQFRRYDPVGNAWTTLANLPTPVAMGSLLYDAAGGRVYLFGGTDGVGVVYDLVQVYNIAGNSWSAGPLMPHVRAFMGSGVIAGKMYLVGGYSTGNVTPAFDTNWEFDPALGTYTVKAILPAQLGGPGSAVSGGQLYIMGGRNAVDNLTSNYEYDPVGNVWATRAVLPTGVNVPGGTALSGAAGCAGDVLIVGGGNPFLTEAASPRGPSRAPQTTAISQVYDVATDTWSAGPTLPETRSFLSAAQAGDTLIVVGGYNGAGSVATVNRIQGPPLPVQLQGFMVQ